MKLTKDYIIDMNYLKEGTEILIEEETPIIGVVETEGGLSNVTDSDMEKLADEFVETLKQKELIFDDTNGLEVAKKVKEFVIHQIQLNGKVEEDEVETYVKTLIKDASATNVNCGV